MTCGSKGVAVVDTSVDIRPELVVVGISRTYGENGAFAKVPSGEGKANISVHPRNNRGANTVHII